MLALTIESKLIIFKKYIERSKKTNSFEILIQKETWNEEENGTDYSDFKAMQDA